jgi:hypothetical protein
MNSKSDCLSQKIDNDIFGDMVLYSNISDFIIGNIKINNKIATFKVILIK